MRQISINELQCKIVENLKVDIINYTTRRLGEDTSFTEEELYRIVFTNFRITDGLPCGIRLTPFGNHLMSKKYDHYKYEYKGKVTNRSFIALDKCMKWPYYVGKKIITFYNEDDAALFRLNGNNINNYVDFL